MRTQSICVALAIVLICPFASGQWIQTNGLNERQVPYHPSKGMNVAQETPRDLLGLLTQDRLPATFVSRLDSLRTSRMHLPLLDGRFIPNGIQITPPPLRRVSSPQSQIYVIDTAIVRRLGNGTYDFGDTMRHLYSFNAKARITSDLTQRLTGGIWVDTLRETNTYDGRNNMLSDLYEYWSNGQWVNSWRWTYTYDANGNRLSELYEEGENGQLDLQWRYTYTYDASNNVLSQLYETWSNGQLNVQWRFTYTYDASNNILSQLEEHWSNGQWVNSARFTYTYDANSNMLSFLDEAWLNNQWVILWRDTYTYDASNNFLSGLSEGWSNGQWVNNSRTTCTYDASNNMLSDLFEEWSNGQWVNYSRDTYSYNANSDMLSWLYELWSNGQWVNDDHWTHTYDASNNMLTKLREVWSNGQWVNYSRFTYTYDAQEHLNSFWHYSWLNSSWTPTDLSVEAKEHFSVSDSAGNFYSYWGYNFTFTGKLVVTGVASQSGNLPAVYSLSQNYPNPFNPSTTIKYELPKTSVVRLTVYDVLGREVSVLVDDRRNAGAYEVKFDGSNLASGVYFYRIQAGDFTQTKRLLLLK
jgi:hypothetical protein